ncbi:coenzyme PQQ biosynthesis protein PqqD [Symbiobacterium terraclitae]|uniref:Coenzyme PQQ biosynthesis protein PqqD n=1 Tax=Symbiobacterium terraclitae TaxID=557451 RepID=A0ABS4JR90_9FIRM|nr:PqqD family protein [Symbiobacterium terraclitae]MBP2018048.1 coenzyme PQQ biosynthesis protein PqqD [Symbiobacterium terraclitae]
MATPFRPSWITVLQEEDDVVTVLNAQTGHVMITNPVGGRILELCDGQKAVPDLIQELAAEYPDAPAEVVDREVRAFLAQAAEKGVIDYA